MEIHYFAAARAARGVDQERSDVEFSTVGALVDHLGTTHAGTTAAGMTLVQVLERCTFLVDGAAATRDTQLAGAHRVDVLPPFAGG